MTEGQSANSPWADPANVALLERLWAEGASASKIANQIPGATKNSVIGRVRRTGLPARPSPIKFKGDGTPRKKVYNTIRRAPSVTLPKLPSIAKPLKLTPRQQGSLGRRPPKPVAEKPVMIIEIPRLSTTLTCQFPIGDPRAEDFRFCGKPALFGGAYCPECHRVCYNVVPVRRALDEAA